jgi:hypothetical protein
LRRIFNVEVEFFDDSATLLLKGCAVPTGDRFDDLHAARRTTNKRYPRSLRRPADSV